MTHHYSDHRRHMYYVQAQVSAAQQANTTQAQKVAYDESMKPISVVDIVPGANANKGTMRILDHVRGPGKGYLAVLVLVATHNLANSMSHQHLVDIYCQGEKIESVHSANRKIASTTPEAVLLPVHKCINAHGELEDVTLTLSFRNNRGIVKPMPHLSVQFSLTELDEGYALAVQKIGKYCGYMVNYQPVMEKVRYTVAWLDSKIDRSIFTNAQLLREVELDVEMTNLPKVDVIGSIDPFFILDRENRLAKRAPGETVKKMVSVFTSAMLPHNKNPVWKSLKLGTVMKMCLGKPDLVVLFKLYDHGKIGNKFIGIARTTMVELLSGRQIDLQLYNDKSEKKDKKLKSRDARLKFQAHLVPTQKSTMAQEYESSGQHANISYRATPARPPRPVQFDVAATDLPSNYNNNLMQSRRMTLREMGMEINNNFDAEDGPDIDQIQPQSHPEYQHAPNAEINYDLLFGNQDGWNVHHM